MDTKEREEELKALKGESGVASAESAATQLALQDAAEAEARTREERDKLRREVERLSRANAELAAKNVELREEAEWWRREAKKQEGYADTLAKKNAWLTAKVAVADWKMPVLPIPWKGGSSDEEL